MTSIANTGQTLAQKLIAHACGRERVAVGEIVTCKVDMAMFHDSSGPRRLQPMLEELGAQIWDKSRVVLVMDHYVPERDDDSRRIVRIARDWPVGARFPEARLRDPDGFAGLDGAFRFGRDGVAERALEVQEIRGGQTVVVSPAPSGFGR